MGRVAPAPTDARGSPSALPEVGASGPHNPHGGRSAPRPGGLSDEKKVTKDSPGTSWFLDLRHKGEDPLGFPRLLP